MVNKLTGVQTLNRGISLLESVSSSLDGLSLVEMAEILQVSQPAAFNLAKTWIDRNYLEKTGRPVRYKVGPMMEELIRTRSARIDSRRAEDAVRTIIIEAPDANVLFAERTGEDFRITLRVDSCRPRLIQRPMASMPNFYTLATGNCLFAFLDPEGQDQMQKRYPFELHGGHLWATPQDFESELKQIAKRGYVLRDKPDFFCVAAPVFGAGDELAGAIGLSVRAQEILPETAQHYISLVRNSSRFLQPPEH